MTSITALLAPRVRAMIRPIRSAPSVCGPAQPRAAAWLLAAALCLAPATAWSQDFNTTFGTDALASNTTGDFNSAFGNSALLRNSTGSSNTATGAFALFDNTTGSGNTAAGDSTLVFNSSGVNNTASGAFALRNNTTGSNNTAAGQLSLFSSTTASRNTAIGREALKALTSGVDNVALGQGAGRLTPSGSTNIYIGHIGVGAGESKVTRIGRTQTKAFIAGIAGTTLSGATVVIKSTGQLGVVASSARYKTDVAPLSAQAATLAKRLAKLEPVTYRYKTDPEATHYGLIAEKVAEVMPELVVRDEQNRPETVQYIELIPLLLQQWQAQQAEIARQRAENTRQNATIERQGAELAELRHLLTTRIARGAGQNVAITSPASIR